MRVTFERMSSQSIKQSKSSAKAMKSEKGERMNKRENKQS